MDRGDLLSFAESLCADSTQGPWQYSRYDLFTSEGNFQRKKNGEFGWVRKTIGRFARGRVPKTPDLRLIVNARSVIEALVEEIKLLESQLVDSPCGPPLDPDDYASIAPFL